MSSPIAGFVAFKATDPSLFSERADDKTFLFDAFTAGQFLFGLTAIASCGHPYTARCAWPVMASVLTEVVPAAQTLAAGLVT